MERDLYATLGVPRTADDETIKKAFRKLAGKYHPDKNPGKDSEQRFKEINQAHEVLSDPAKRSAYDEFGADALRPGFDVERARMMKNFQRGGGRRQGGGGGFDFFGGQGGNVDLGDIFGDIFGGQRGGAGGPGRARGPRKAPDAEAEVHVDFVSALRGTTVELTRQGGETVTVRIPAGVSDGGRVRIAGQGSKFPGAEPGDLLLTVHVAAHPCFERKGDDLHLDLPITVVEAYEGAKVRVPTLDGEVALKVPPRTQSGQVSRLRGKGVQKKGKTPGDLYVRFLVQIPVTDAPEVAKAMEALRHHVEDPRGDIKL